MFTKTRFLLAVCLALVATGPGCVIYDADATLTLTWDFRGGSCAQAGVRSVLVQLDDLEGFVESFDALCEDGVEGFTIDGVTPGLYHIGVEGNGPILWFASFDADLHGGDNLFHVTLEPY